MQSIIDVFRMSEVSPQTRANLIIKLGILINSQYAANVTEPLVAELVRELHPTHEILSREIYNQHLSN